MGTNDKFTQALELPGKFLAHGAHAWQDIPSQHRLLNAGGMFAGWWALDQLRCAAFGLKMKSEGEYVEVKREEVPLPLQFLHKTIEWDPHSETPENQWKKLAYQMFPGVGAGVGAVAGSMFAFERNGRAQKALQLKKSGKLGVLDADFLAQYEQSTPLRVLSGAFGTFSSASGLTFLYGFFLNPAFAAANGAKIFTGSLATGNAAPHKAAPAAFDMVGSHVKQAIKTGKMSDAWAKQFTTRVLEPLFEHELHSPEGKAQAVKTLQGIVEESYQKFKSSGKKPEEVAKAVTDDLTKLLGGSGLDKTLKTKFGLDPLKALPGNANPTLRIFNDFMVSMGLARKIKVGAQTPKAPSDLALVVPAAGLVGAGGVASFLTRKGHAADMPSDTSTTESTVAAAESKSPEEPAADSETSLTKKTHVQPDTEGKTAEEYTNAAVALHTDVKAPPGWMKWIGEGQLAVLPKNRMSCAIGLTTGQLIMGHVAAILTGFALDKKPVDINKVPTFMQGMYKVVKDYNPKGLRPRDRWINYAQLGLFTLGGFIGVKIGTDYAYGDVPKKHKDPHYLEDYLPRVSMHQGETWGWLGAAGSSFGSSAGLFVWPIPGANYGLSLAGRTTSMQDRNFMLPGVNKSMSGAATTSFLRLKEGLNYLCHYAVGNPSENPAQIEYLAYTMLGPIFNDRLTAEHIKHFTDAVHEVRDQYWQEGGIPKEKRAEAMKTMREVFTGPGFEVMLIDMGLNPGEIAFDKLNGLTGAIGNFGVSEKIHKEQESYHNALLARLPSYVEQNFISQERADWVKAGIEAMHRGEKIPSLPADEPVIAPEHIPSIDIPEKKPFAAKETRKNSIDELIKRSEKPGDWRDAARLERDRPAQMAVE